MWNLDIPVRYLRENFEREDRLAIVLIDRERNMVEQKFSTAEKIASPKYQAFLRRANVSGADVYVTWNQITHFFLLTPVYCWRNNGIAVSLLLGGFHA